ncbi:MAG TPA: acetoacetate decarboxylase family protein [Dehalococcoidia bacterium]|nr:acetoacetate decarboxylase family protein [Dehalococcoidia bacterium]
MRFVKTAEEIRQVQAVHAQPQFLDVRSLTVLFETTPQAIAALLPPPLAPTPEPLGRAWVGEVHNSNCVGPFLGAALYVRARYQDVVGDYCITMPMSTAEAVTFGRELYGEPKKLAKIVFEREGEHVWGSAERLDIRYLSLRGRMTEKVPGGRSETSSFHFKFLPRPDGSGFDHPPVLVHVVSEANVQAAERGKGELVLRDSPHDPVADIPVSQVIAAVYTEGHVYSRGRILCEADPEAFLPYAFGNIDSFEVLAEGTALHAQAARKTREGKGQWRGTA